MSIFLVKWQNTSYCIPCRGMNCVLAHCIQPFPIQFTQPIIGWPHQIQEFWIRWDKIDEICLIVLCISVIFIFHTQTKMHQISIGRPVIGCILDSLTCLLHIFQHKFFGLQYINSCTPSATYMCRWTRSALVQIMACCLFGTKPLSEPMLEYC